MLNYSPTWLQRNNRFGGCKVALVHPLLAEAGGSQSAVDCFVARSSQ